MATQLTTALARVYDPVLSNIAQGYRNNEFVGNALFPVVPVGQRGGRIISFGREDFQLYATARAPGSNTKRIQVGYSGAPFTLEQHALEGFVPFELQDEASAVPGIDLARRSVNAVQNIIDTRLEKAQADLATTAGNYAASNKNTALAGATLWSDPAGSDPLANVMAGREAIRAATGRYPNTMVVGPKVLNALQVHGDIIDRIKYTGGLGRVATAADLAAYFQVERFVVGSGVYMDSSGAFVDLWGKNVVLAYTIPGSLADQGAPTYGYTYRLRGFPMVETPYQDRNAKSWIYPVTDEVAPVIAAATAGFLISPAVA